MSQFIGQAMMSGEEWATLQQRSDAYEPDLEGPLIGAMQSTVAIAEEYAQGDPFMAQKTAAIPDTWPQGRKVIGDGNCFWRALIFCYFEMLLRLQDPMRFLAEEERIQSFNILLEADGLSAFIYMDWVDQTVALLRRLAASLSNEENSAALLLTAMNDEEITAAIITLFRLITSAFMKSHSEVYQPYLFDQTVMEYCKIEIEPYRVEIDEPGITAVIDAIVIPADMRVNILILDRAGGDELRKVEAQKNGVRTMNFLFRPGHYDILYTFDDVAEIMSLMYPTSMVNRVSPGCPSSIGVDQLSVQVPMDLDPSNNGFWNYRSHIAPEGPLSFVPGITLDARGGSERTYEALYESFDICSSSASQNYSHGMSQIPMKSLPVQAIPTNARETLFRKTNYQYKLEEDLSAQAVPYTRERPICQSSRERPAHFERTAHFSNALFQPEVYKPRTKGKSKYEDFEDAE